MNHDEENRACDKNMLIGGNIKCTCGKTVLHNYSEGEMQNPAQKEEKIMEQWEVDFNAKFLFAGDRTGSKLKDFLRSQIALAEQRGRDAQQKEDYEVAKAQQEKAFKSGAEMGENRGRMETITAFVEWANRNLNNTGDDSVFDCGYSASITDLLSFADSLKSNLTEK